MEAHAKRVGGLCYWGIQNDDARILLLENGAGSGWRGRRETLFSLSLISEMGSRNREIDHLTPVPFLFKRFRLSLVRWPKKSMEDEMKFFFSFYLKK